MIDEDEIEALQAFGRRLGRYFAVKGKLPFWFLLEKRTCNKAEVEAAMVKYLIRRNIPLPGYLIHEIQDFAAAEGEAYAQENLSTFIAKARYERENGNEEGLFRGYVEEVSWELQTGLSPDTPECLEDYLESCHSKLFWLAVEDTEVFWTLWDLACADERYRYGFVRELRKAGFIAGIEETHVVMWYQDEPLKRGKLYF
ncbi:MAG: hypothetical protein N2170_00815 [Bacteroidia bacterium]|nr:hypothetical protein [Bacteroidia bacterium]